MDSSAKGSQDKPWNKGQTTWGIEKGLKGRGKKGKSQGNMRRDWKLNAKEQNLEYRVAHNFLESVSPNQLVSDSAVAKFLRRLGVAAALDLDGNIFIRDKSLVSHVLYDIPLKISKQSRNALVSKERLQSASHGSLLSSIFFEVPQVVEFPAIHSERAGMQSELSEDVSSEVTESVFKFIFDNRSARATLVISTQKESDEAVTAVVNEAQRIVSDMNAKMIPDLSHMKEDLETTKQKSESSTDDCGHKEEDVNAEDQHSIPKCFRDALILRLKQQRELHSRFHALLQKLRLEEAEAAECERRGILQQIAQDVLFRSWRGGIFRDIPRIRENGEIDTFEMFLPPGLFIPARNVEGLVCGLQFRPRGAEMKGTTEEKGPAAAVPRKAKYLWVSKDKSIKGNTGMLPFFCVCCRWSCREHTVAFVEGGLKAYAFAFLARRFPVIGASGGQWHQCGEGLLHALARLNARRVLLFADAGAVQNRLVMLDYLRTLRLLNLEWGVEVRFVWWGQVEKNQHFDCDDQLLDLRSCDGGGAKGDDLMLHGEDMFEAVTLTPAEFWHQVPQELQNSLREQRSARDLLRSLHPLLDEHAARILASRRRR